MTTKTTAQAVAVAEPAKTAMVLADTAPAFMEQDRGEGLSNLDTADFTLPRVTLLQALSAPVQDDDQPQGTFYHILAEENLGTSMRCAIIDVRKNVVLWRPRNDTSGARILARSENCVDWNKPNSEFEVTLKSGKKVKWNTGKDVRSSGLTEWGSADPADPESEPAATVSLNLLVMNLDNLAMGPFILSLQRAQLKHGEALKAKLLMASDRCPTYGQVFDISSKKVTDVKGSFFSYKFERAGFIQDESVYKLLKNWHEQIQGKTIAIDGEDDIEPATEAADAGPNGIDV